MNLSNVSQVYTHTHTHAPNRVVWAQLQGDWKWCILHRCFYPSFQLRHARLMWIWWTLLLKRLSIATTCVTHSPNDPNDINYKGTLKSEFGFRVGKWEETETRRVLHSPSTRGRRPVRGPAAISPRASSLSLKSVNATESLTFSFPFYSSLIHGDSWAAVEVLSGISSSIFCCLINSACSPDKV